MPSTGRWRLWTAVSPHGRKLHVVCSLELAGVQTNGPTVQSEPHFGFYASVLVRAVEGGVVFSGVRTHQTVNILPRNMLICFDKHILRDHCKKRVILAKVLISDIFNFSISASAPRMDHLSGSDENTKTSPGLCCLSECLPPSRLFSLLSVQSTSWRGRLTHIVRRCCLGVWLNPDTRWVNSAGVRLSQTTAEGNVLFLLWWCSVFILSVINLSCSFFWSDVFRFDVSSLLNVCSCQVTLRH